MKSNQDRPLPQADRQNDRHNVVTFRPRGPKQQQRRSQREARVDPQDGSAEMRRYPVDIRGNVTFSRLVQGLATVGLTVRVDPRSGHVVIADYPE